MSQPTPETPAEQKVRKFPLAFPRRWKNKITGKEFKALPWFQPIDEASRYDFKGIMEEVFPEFKDDIMKDFNVYSGLVMQIGWQILNDGNVWFCMPHEYKEGFDDIGPWVEEDGPAHVTFPLTGDDPVETKP